MGIFGRILAKFSGAAPSASDLNEIERSLLASDLGPNLTREIIELVKRERGSLLESVSALLKSYFLSVERKIDSTNTPTTIMVVGVNGTGKTTSVAKLAYYFNSQGKKVLLTAADTFRAAAIEQLETWSERVGVSLQSAASGSDPAAVAFDGAKRALAEKFDIHIIDTAGRLHTQSNLMAELSKIRRVVEKVTPVNEALLVLDGAMGQNGIAQAREFTNAIELSGLIVTKLDGSAKGGAALLIEKELGLPIKFIGEGEAMTDLAEFNPDSFVARLLAEG